LIDTTKDLAGVRVENKELTVAMHVRGAASAAQQQAERSFREIAEPQRSGLSVPKGPSIASCSSR
jgi:trehalose-6-phosphatase